MSNSKEIKGKIRSIKNTQKITGAMEMVAASKMRKVKEIKNAGQPYANAINNVVSRLVEAEDVEHVLLNEREVKNTCFLVVSTNRGLCGGLNTNLFKHLLPQIKEIQKQKKSYSLALCGDKSCNFFKNDPNIISAMHLSDDFEKLNALVKILIDKYVNNQIDKVVVVYNKFVNAMTQTPCSQQILPIQNLKSDSKTSHRWDYIYEGDKQELLGDLLTKYIESQIYQAIAENNACEQASRMMAMKNATDNANNLIDKLQLEYNKTRQAAITQELSEICAGASAV